MGYAVSTGRRGHAVPPATRGGIDAGRNLCRTRALSEDMDPLENNHKQRRWLITAIVVVVAALVGLFFLRRGKDDGAGSGLSEEVLAAEGSLGYIRFHRRASPCAIVRSWRER